MVILSCILFVVLLFGSSLISLVYVWKKKAYRSFLVQFVIVILSITGGIYAIVQHPDIFSIAKALNDLSPLK